MHSLIALVGPTAVGKSAIAVELAEQLGAEIVSCDSMQVYKHMTVLSQAPSKGQRTRVPHHFVESVEPSESYSAGQYAKFAPHAIRQILARGKKVIITGGTGLYLKALTEGLCDTPPADITVRDRLWDECQGVGAVRLHNRLRAIDESAASKIHPNDARRIIRALEVYAITGKPISAWWKETVAEFSEGQVLVIGVNRDRETLYTRINNRLLHMIYEEGVINEVRDMLHLPLSKTARQVHGLADLEHYLAGRVSLKETITIWQSRVRHYARRQLIWFRQTPHLHWVDLPEIEPPWETAANIVELIRRQSPSQHVAASL